MLCLRALINHSSRVYAGANTARLTLRPYQLTESGPQSIIPHVTRHVVGRRVRKQSACVFAFRCVSMFTAQHVSWLNMHRRSAACGYFIIYMRRQKIKGGELQKPRSCAAV